MHHKLEYDDEKRNVFSLKVSSVDACRLSTGSMFQAVVPAMLKAISPNLDHVLSCTRSCLSANAEWNASHLLTKCTVLWDILESCCGKRYRWSHKVWMAHSTNISANVAGLEGEAYCVKPSAHHAIAELFHSRLSLQTSFVAVGRTTMLIEH